MRTRNHFCLGEGLEGFLTVLAGHYPAGRIAVLCQDLAEGSKLSAALLKTYKITLLAADEKERKKEDVRFVIGIGSPKIVPAVKEYAEDVPFAFYAKTADYRYLRMQDERLSEFAYLDKTVDPKDYYPSCYSSLFCLWCEGKTRLLEQSCFPYRDKKLIGVLDSAEKVLAGEADKEEFLSECLRLISVLSCHFYAYPALYTDSVLDPSQPPEKQFVTSYFLINLLKTFTKLPRNAILNPSEERKIDYVFDLSVLPDNEKMRAFANRMKAMASLPTADAEEVLSLLAAARRPELPLFVSLCENGLLEGWKDEEIRRDRGVFI